MPSLDDSGASVSPWADPLSYPGTAVDADYLWVDSWMYEMSPDPRRAAADGQWQVRVDGGPLATEPQRAGLGVDEALALAGAAPMSARRPVVSFGSNSAPAQLRAKFAALPQASRAIPVLRAVVRGLGLGHSPHVSDPGYLPFVLVDSGTNASLPVFVSWLDSCQLRTMNGTEPNYDLVAVPADRYPLVLRTGLLLAEYFAYKGKWGALRLPGAEGPLGAGSQETVFAELNAIEWFRSLIGEGDPGSQIGRLRGDGGLRDRVRIELAASGMVSGDGWTAVGQ